ncbi:MAG: twin-arginine translocase TatA/TatE family subunit [Solirubrobacteraceae bacterium]
MGIDSPVHLLFLGAVALLVLGPKRLPEVARALGKGMREFREAINVDGTPTEVRTTPEDREHHTS